jgi:Cu(I)/Ag(I) efflux system membrane fusion protein
MLSKKLRILALVLGVVLVMAVGAVFGRRMATLVQQQSSGHDTANMPASEAQQGHAGHDMSQTPAAAPGERKVLYWYDPMHPAYRSDKPGIAPDCGMKLAPKYADEEQAMANMAPGTVMLSTEKQQLIGVRTAQVRRDHLVRTIRTVGRVTPDETKLAHIHVKVSGWIDKVYVDFVGQLVKKGQPLFTLYSPDLVATQEEYLIAQRGEDYLGKAPYREVSQGASSLLHATRDRLRLWDISDEQIKKLNETGEITRTMTFYSPVTGFVLERKAFPETSVAPDTELYLVADLSDIWVDADVYEYEVPYVHLGQEARMTLSYYPGKTYRGRVSYVYPTVDPKTRTVKVRLEFPNPGFDLKPNMFANVELDVDYGVQTLVPSEAVLDSGTRQVVFLAKPDGYFEPRQIQVGAQLDGQYIVLKGLNPGDTVVTSGNFLIDSESRLSSAVGGTSHKH